MVRKAPLQPRGYGSIVSNSLTAHGSDLNACGVQCNIEATVAEQASGARRLPHAHSMTMACVSVRFKLMTIPLSVFWCFVLVRVFCFFCVLVFRVVLSVL